MIYCLIIKLKKKKKNAYITILITILYNGLNI